MPLDGCRPAAQQVDPGSGDPLTVLRCALPPDDRPGTPTVPGPADGLDMLPLTDKTLRATFVNASRKEVADLTPPPGLDQLDWDALDHLGWRDPKLPRRAYLVTPSAGRPADEPVGLLLLQAEATPRRRAQCAWCEDVTLPNPVVFYSARRAGAAGRSGSTVGTLVCQDFECAANVRRLPPLAYPGFDREAGRLERIATLRLRTAAFADAVLRGA